MTRVVKLVFIDDDPAKRAFCDESNRTARAFKIPRVLLDSSSNRDELAQVGLYLLIGTNDNEIDRPFVYVGEAENVYTRLKQHHDQFSKFDWHTGIALISQDKSLNKAHVKYLEHRWHDRLVNANIASMDQTIPTKSSLNESDQAVAEDFSKTGQFLVEALGFRLFEVRSQTAVLDTTAGAAPRFAFTTSRSRGNTSYGYPTDDGFVVLAGSVLDPDEKPAGIEYWAPVRKQLRDDGVIGQRDSKLIFLKDWLAPSPSRAAAVVYGGSVNGLEYWRIEGTKETLRAWQARNTLA